MRIVEKFSIFGSHLLRIVIGIMIVSLITVSVYGMWDSYRIERNAFSSYDLSKYRPNVEEDEPITLEEIETVNKDVKSWLTIYNTHIDYPVAQGRDDLEYVNKDIYGKTTPTGSIYLATENHSDYSDVYNIIYGHHVANGSMFGDITEYLDKSFFNSHLKGVLILDNQVYDLEVFAIMETEAYDSAVYNSRNITNTNQILPYIKEHSKYFRNLSNISHILMLSTCDDTRTNGRTCLFLKMTPHEGEYEPYTVIENKDTPLGLLRREDYWAFLNLICLLATIYTMFPIHIFSSKFKRKIELENSKDIVNDIYNINEEDIPLDFYDNDKFYKKFKSGWILELIFSVIALILFILTENIWLPIRMIDFWTPFMLALFLIVCVLDIKLCRFNNDEYNDDEGEESIE